MKIENNQPNPISSNPTGNANPVEKNSRAAGSPADKLNKKDSASLSEQAKILAKAHAVLQKTEDTRTDKVEELREKIESGAYSIPLQELAQRLISKFKE